MDYIETSVRENFQIGFNTIRIEYSYNELNLSNAIGGELYCATTL